MGLKLTTLAYCSVKNLRVKLHTTEEKAHVIAKYEQETRKMSYRLRFGDGRIEPVTWSQDNQGYVSLGVELDEVDEPVPSLF